MSGNDALLDAFPSRAPLDWDLLDGVAVLAVPKRMGRFERMLARLFPGPEIVFIRFDALGTEGWLAADGSVAVRVIGERLAAKFGADAEPVNERALAFFADLGRRGFVRLAREPASVDGSVRGFGPSRGYRSVACRKCGKTHPMKARSGARYLCPYCRRVTRA